MHRIPDTNIVFAHIPKTAGQAIKAALGIRSQTAAHEVNKRIDRNYLADKYIRFCVVRHPIERAISAFRYNAHHATMNPTGVRSYLLRAKAEKDINVFLAHAEINRVNILRWDHFKPQTDFISMIQPQIILRHERLDQDLKILSALLGGREITLPLKNAAAQRTQDGLNTTLNDDSKAYLARLYAEDFRFLGYRGARYNQ